MKAGVYDIAIKFAEQHVSGSIAVCLSSEDSKHYRI